MDVGVRTGLRARMSGGRTWAVVVAVVVCAPLGLGACAADRSTGATSRRAITALSAPAALVSCPHAVRRFGMTAFAARGRLELVDLAPCRVRVLAGAAAASVRFSPDGRWLADAQQASGTPTRLVVLPSSGGADEAVAGRSWLVRGRVFRSVRELPYVSCRELRSRFSGGVPRLSAWRS